ncbi:zinc finger protein 831 [Discoglossus pictus]
METSKVTVLSSELPWPASTSTTLTGIHQHTVMKHTDQSCPQTVFLKAVTMPLYQLSQTGGCQPPFQLANGGAGLTLDRANMSVLLNHQPSTVIQKLPSQTLTLNILNTLPVLPPGCSPSLMSVSPGKSKNVGKHICAHCGRDCLKPSVLEKHLRSHTGERPFPCTTCGIAFKTQSNLYKHRKTQTHVNNCKSSVDSDCSSCQEYKTSENLGDNPLVCPTDNTDLFVCTAQGECAKKEMAGTDSSTQGNTILSDGNEEVLPTCMNSLQSTEGTSGKTLGDHENAYLVSQSVLNQRRMMKDQWSPKASRQIQLQRQHATYVDKQWDYNPSERKLKKCESTDSGYLSHSDSIDLQFFTGSPLNSLSENSIESEYMSSSPALKPNVPNTTIMECLDKTTPSMEKKKLEEHISMLISQNKVVVDDTQLDNVRPRKTALSKQGSIDLPMPYTFKDSFHFDIRSLDVNRKKVSICPSKSIFTPPERNKPLFFHSVPTQFSTTMENITVSRSNSLPFTENCRIPPDKVDVHASKHPCLAKQPLDTSFANLLLTNQAVACTVDFSNSHPRSLVRQTAVDEIPINSATESYAQEGIKDRKKHAGDKSTPKSKAGSRKGGQKKLNMFSHEKWQMYGDETFKKLYQKIQKNESIKKLKQGVALPKHEANNEHVLQTSNGSVISCLASTPAIAPTNCNPNESSCSSQANLLPQVASGNSNHKPSQRMETHLSPINLHNSTCLAQEDRTKLSSGIQQVEMSGLERKQQPLKNPPTNIDMPYTPSDFPQPVLTSHNIAPTGSSETVVIISNNGHGKLPSTSHTEHNVKVCSNNVLTDSEKSPSERKKFKVEELKDTESYNIKDYIKLSENIHVQNASYLELAQNVIVDELKVTDVDGNNGPVDTITGTEDRQSLFEGILKCPNSSLKDITHVNVCDNPGEATAHVLVQMPLIRSPLTENKLSENYLINLPPVECPPEMSNLLEANKDGVFGAKCEERGEDHLNPTHKGPDKDVTDAIAESHMNIHTDQKQDVKTIMQTQYPPTGSVLKSSLNAVHIPISSSVLSIHGRQNKTQDTHGDYDCKDISDLTYTERHNKNTVQVPVQSIAPIAPFYNGGFLISSGLGNCPEQILQQNIESNDLVHIQSTTENEARIKSEITQMLVNMSTEHAQNLDDPTKVLGPTIDKPNACMSTCNQPANTVSTQDSGCFVQSSFHQSLHSGNHNVKATKTSIPSLKMGQEPRTCFKGFRLNRNGPLPGANQEKPFSVYSSFHHDALKRERPELKHWTEHLNMKYLSKKGACGFSSTGNPKSLDLTSLCPSQKQKETLGDSVPCPEGVKEKGASKSQASAKRSSKTGPRTKNENKKRYGGGRQRKYSTCGSCKQAARERFHYKKCHPMTKASLQSNSRQTKCVIPVADTAEVSDELPNPLQRPCITEVLREKENPECIPSASGGDRKEEGDNNDKIEETFSISVSQATVESLEPCQESSLKCHNSLSVDSMYKDLDAHGGCEDNTNDLVASGRKQDHAPQQKPGRKVLHRSKTIGHSLGDHSTYQGSGPSYVSSMPELMCSNLKVSGDEELKSRQDQNKNISGHPQEPGALSCIEQSPPQNDKESVSLQPTVFKSQKKLNLEVLRKQTHVEYSDSSSDDEDRLVIEI